MMTIRERCNLFFLFLFYLCLGYAYLFVIYQATPLGGRIFAFEHRNGKGSLDTRYTETAASPGLLCCFLFYHDDTRHFYRT